MSHASKEKGPFPGEGTGHLLPLCPPRRSHKKALDTRSVSGGDYRSQAGGGKKTCSEHKASNKRKITKTDNPSEHEDMGRLHEGNFPEKGAQVYRGIPSALRRTIAAAQRIGTIHKKEIPETEDKVAVIDFETDPFVAGEVPQAFACGWTDSKGTSTFWSEKENEVITWAAKKVIKHEGYVYAHNGGKFDFPGYLFRGAGKAMLYQPVMLIGSRIVKMRIGMAEIRDSYAILPSPLSAYDKGEIDYEKFKRGVRGNHKLEILAYLRRDCDSLRILVCRFIREHGVKVLTAASAAMAAMKRHAEVATEALTESQDSHLRQWYFGGRVGAFKPGIHHGVFNVYDIKSAYPHAMTFAHPASASYEFMAGAERDIQPTDFVICDGDSGGHFPIRGKNKLLWPKKGKFFVSGHEYLAARACGEMGKMKVIGIERPEFCADYKKYVMEFYHQKEMAERDGDKAGRLIAKILINSGYGKLAQRPDRWEEHMIVKSSDVIPETSPDHWDLEHETSESYVDTESGFCVWSRPSTKPVTFYNVGAAASITGKVRASLIPVIRKYKPFYCDTDSVIISGEMKTGKELGDWDFETSGDLLVIAGKKLYGLRITKDICPDEKTADAKGYDWDGERGWKMATKGCRLTPQELMKVAKGEEVVYHNQAPTFSLKAHTRFISRTIRKTI